MNSLTRILLKAKTGTFGRDLKRKLSIFEDPISEANPAMAKKWKMHEAWLTIISARFKAKPKWLMGSG